MAQFPGQDTDRATDAPASIRSAMRRIRALQVVAGVLIVAALALLAHGLLTPASPSGAAPVHVTTPGVLASATPTSANPLVGYDAPDVTVRDMHDHLTPLSSLRGSVVLLNFWYVSCPPCQIEMPALERAYLKYQAQGFKVVGIDVVDDPATIAAFTSRLGITYPILRDIGERAVLAYQVRATPSSYLIDRNGVIRTAYAGPVTPSTLDQQLAPLL